MANLQDELSANYAAEQAALTNAHFNPQPVAPRGVMGEIGTGLKRGALVGLPTMVGKALQYTGAPGDRVHDFGQGMVTSADTRGAQPSLTMRPEEHGTVVNALASGAEMLAPSLAPAAAVGLGIAAAGASPFIATVGAAAAGGALFGAETGQNTLEKGRKAGLDEPTALEAARLNAATTMAAQTGMGMIGGQLLGTFGRTMNRTIGRESAPLVERTLADLAGSDGVLKPLLKQFPLTTAEAVGVNAAQAAGAAQIEKSYGVDDTSPLTAAGESIAPTLGLTALMGPMALVGRAMNVRAAKSRTEALSHPETPEGVRTQLAGVYADRLAVNDPVAAQAFRENAAIAIKEGRVLEVDSRLLSPNAVTPTPPTGIDALTTAPGAAEAPAGALAGPPAPPRDVAAPGWETAPGAQPPRDGLDFTREVDTNGLALVPPGQPTPAELLRSAPPLDTSELATRLQASRQAEADVSSLYERVRGGLIDAGMEPARPLSRVEFAAQQGEGKTGQALAKAYRSYLEAPETQRDIMRRDAAAFDELSSRPPAEEPVRNAPPDAARETLAEPPVANTAMADALTSAIKKRDEARAYAERDAVKERETDAIANIGTGARLAEDAVAGRVQPDINAPKARDAIEADWTAAMTANEMDTKAQSRVPFMKRLDALGVDQMATHAEQIAAVESIAADKKASQGVRDRASMLAEQWKKEQPDATTAEPTVEQRAAALPPLETTPPGSPAIAGQPALNAQAALGDNLPAAKPPAPPVTPIAGQPAAVNLGDNLPLTGRGMPVTEFAQAVGDRVAELRAGLNERVRAGETLTPADQARAADLAGYAQSLAPLIDGNAKPRDLEWVKTIAGLVDEAAAPSGKKTLQRIEIPGPKMEDPNQSDMGLLAPAALSHKVADVMVHLGKDGSQGWVKDLAAKLQPLMGETTIWPEGVRSNMDPSRAKYGELVGEYDLGTDSIHIARATEATILHEALHAATAARIERGLNMKTPANQQDAQIRKSVKELEGLMATANKLPGAAEAYGLTNVHEFVAEVHSNADFRDFLRQQPGGIFGRIVDAIRSLLGLKPTDNKLVERALDSSEALFSTERLSQQFDSSPEGAARSTDMTLQRMVDDVDRKVFSVDTGRAALAMLRGFLPLQTNSYIANRVRSNPELVASGFSAGLDAERRADTSRSVVTNRLKDVGNQYIHGAEKVFQGMDEGKARGLQSEMMTIAGEASRVGFDYRKNGRDNLATDATLDAADKPYMDEIHRRWTQLEKQNPEAARMVEAGERINRKSLIDTVSTVASTLMDDRAGRQRHLEAEIARMTPQDANWARKQDELKLITTESLMAERFARGLDLMDPTLAKGKNTDPTRYHDGATATLADRLKQTFDVARTLPDGSPLKTALGSLEAMYTKESRHPYFSLGRDGDYFVKVGFKDIDAATNDRIQDALKGTNKVVGDLTRGDSHAYFRVKTASEASALGERLVAAGQGKVIDSAWGKASEKVQEVASVAPALRSLLTSVDEMQFDGMGREASDSVKSALTRQLLSMLPETAARSAQMGRRGVPGYDGNFIASFAHRAQGAVNDVANAYSSRAFAAAADQRIKAIEQLNRTGSADGKERAQLIDDEINKRFVNNMKATSGDWVQQATSLSHSFYLGLSPAFFIRTMAQPWMRGIPFIGSKFGFGGAVGELIAAQAAGLKLVANSVGASTRRDGVKGLLNAPVELQNLGLSPREQAWVQEAHANGKLDLGESSQLMRAAQSDGGGKMQTAMRYAAMTAQYAEMANRFGMGLAAFRLAAKRPELLPKGMTPETYALQAMEMAMDDFSATNTARAIGRHGWAGKMTPLFAQFQNYNLQTMQQISRTVHDGLFNQDKSPEGMQRSKEAKREFAGLMATSGMIAGALGLPFANAFAGVYNALASDPDDPKDARIAMRTWMMDTFGKQMGTVMAKGLPSLINLDTSTFGAQGILPGSDFLADRTAWKERSETQVRGALGPAVSLGLDLTNAVSKMSEGYWAKGIEAALPIGVRSFFKTANMATSDFYTDSKGNPTPMPITAGDVAWRALGFQTEAKSQQGDAQRDFIVNQQRLKHRRELIQDQFVKASLDPSQTPGAVESLTAYNAKNPYQPLGANDIRNAVVGFHTRNALGAASGLGIPTTKRAYPVLLEEERFAAMPAR